MVGGLCILKRREMDVLELRDDIMAALCLALVIGEAGM